jgi:hypothetical protein
VNNVVVRSGTPGSRFTIDWTGGTANVINAQGNNWYFKDIQFTETGATKPTGLISFGKSASTRFNYTADNILYSGACTTQAIACTNDPIGVLVQHCNIFTTLDVQCVWGGNTFNRRLITLVNNTLENTQLGRPFRGKAIGVTIDLCTMIQSSPSDAKSCLDLNHNQYAWVRRCTMTNTLSGNAVQIGHTTLSDPVSDVVIEQCKFTNAFTPVADPRSCVWIAPNTSTVERLCIRNCIFEQGYIDNTNTATDVRVYHNTFKIDHLRGRMGILAAGASDWKFRGNVLINPLIQFATGGATDSAFRVTTTDDTASQVSVCSDNITAVPVSSSGGSTDVRIVDSVNGNKQESWATANARTNFDGNLRKAVVLYGNYQPTNVSDTDLIVALPSDMALFAEDYYGQARTAASSIKGAVDVTPTNIAVIGGIGMGSGTVIGGG